MSDLDRPRAVGDSHEHAERRKASCATFHVGRSEDPDCDFVDDLCLPLDAFVRSIGVNSRSPHAFLLGAGASITSGVPSAGMCVWEWKRQIFLTKNPRLQEQLSDVSLENVQQRIQHWVDTEGCYPALHADDEYSFYAGLCYPIPDDRRRFFENLAQSALPFVGYKLLCLMAEAGIIKSIWTTNFDGLAAR